MFSIQLDDFLLTMASVVILLGVGTMIAGVVVLLSRVLGKDVRTIADQTSKMAQKGIAEEMAGLVGNASALLDALNNLVKTAAGIGIFLVFVGIGLMVLAYFLITLIH